MFFFFYRITRSVLIIIWIRFFPSLFFFFYSLSFTIKQIGIQFENFPPGAGGGIATIPISPAPPSEGYIITIDFTPAALGVNSISLPFTVIPAGAISFYVGGVAIDPTVGFSFVGNNRAIAFGVATQTSAASGVTLSFGTPIVTGTNPLSPAGFSIPASFSATFVAGGGNVGLLPSTSSTSPATSNSAVTSAPSSAAASTTPAPAGSTTKAPVYSSANICIVAGASVLLAIAALFA